MFRGYYGSDGSTWTSIGTITAPAMPQTLRVGLAAWNYNAVAFDAQFDQFTAALGAVDSFDTPHNYTTDGTAGTIWDGVQGTGYALGINTVMNPGTLTIELPGGQPYILSNVAGLDLADGRTAFILQHGTPAPPAGLSLASVYLAAGPWTLGGTIFGGKSVSSSG